MAVEPAPAFLSALDQLEDHGERGLVREAALRADRPMAHRREGALDRVRGPQVLPMLGREVRGGSTISDGAVSGISA